MTGWTRGAERSSEQAVTLWTHSFSRKPVTPDLARQEGRDVSGRDRQCANASTSATMPEYLEITTVAPPRGFGFLLAREIGCLFPAGAPAIRTRTFSGWIVTVEFSLDDFWEAALSGNAPAALLT